MMNVHGDCREQFWFTPQVPVGRLAIDVDSDVYDMNHAERGRCLIFMNENFEKYDQLDGIDYDAQDLDTTFKSFGFDVSRYNDYPTDRILNTLEEVSHEDHEKRDCFVCCFLTHGSTGVLNGSDGRFPILSVLEKFMGDVCPSLIGKPKIFIILACQGRLRDAGVNVSLESTDATVCTLPACSDLLLLFSSTIGYVSFLTPQGSYFIQSLCRCLNELAGSTDLLKISTVVSRKVAYNFVSRSKKEKNDNKKQQPLVISTLTRDIYFRRHDNTNTSQGNRLQTRV